MKRPLLLVLMITGGIVLGGGAGWAASQFLDPGLITKAEPVKEVTAFVEVPRMLAPLVDSEGRLLGYNRFVVQVEVPASEADALRQKVPLLQDAINMRTFRTPMAAGPDGLRPNLDVLRSTARAAAEQVYGKAVVRRVLITEAQPA